LSSRGHRRPTARVVAAPNRLFPGCGIAFAARSAMRARVLYLFVLGGLLTGCEGSGPDPDGDEVSLEAADVRRFEIRRSSGLAGAVPSERCRARGTWSVDLARGTIRGTGCVSGTTVQVDRSLSSEERARLRRAVGDLEVAHRASVCPADAGSTTLDVVRAQREERYIGERTSCRSEATPVTARSINALYDAVVTAAVAGAPGG